MIYSKDIT